MYSNASAIYPRYDLYGPNLIFSHPSRIVQVGVILGEVMRRYDPS